MMGCPSSTRTRTWPSRSSMMRRQPFRRLNAVKKNCILNYQKRKKKKFLLKILSQFKVLIHRVTTTSRSFPIEIITILFLVTRNYQSNSTTRSIQCLFYGITFQFLISWIRNNLTNWQVMSRGGVVSVRIGFINN